MTKAISVVLAIGMVGAFASPSKSTSSAARSCDRQSVAALVRNFVNAYNKGDAERLDSMWASEPDFEWYSVSPDERERDDAYQRETLIPYFRERHQLGDRLRLKTLRVGPEDDQGNFGIGYRLHRRSQQQDATGRYHGKASAKEVMTPPSVDGVSLSKCVLFVWSMGKS
ncbi:MAG TPA: nuclear transport factor 2 family protein [Actinomycetota bacterium]|nr:nuclear transport factor 2 family protein [Actinomycetota bacterium]